MVISVPSKMKYRKEQKGRTRSKVKAGDKLAFGDYGLKAIEVGRLNARQIEAARVAATRKMERQGRLNIKVFPSIPVSKKPIEVRMGKGKGSTDHFMFRVSPGRIIFEVSGVPHDVAIRALQLATGKLPFKTKITIRPRISEDE